MTNETEDRKPFDSESADAISQVWPKPRVLYDTCPLCNSADMKPILQTDCSRHPLYKPIVPTTMTWMRCQACSHVFTDGIFSPEVSAEIFKTTHNSQKPGDNFERQRQVSARMVEIVARYVKGGPWLDVGFGNGSLLFTAEEWGFSPVGLDLRQSNVEAMRQLGFEAHCVDLSDFQTSDRFSVISLADVLEHMPFPSTGLRAAKRLLEPNGVLFLSMPNYGCAAWRLLDAAQANPYWGELEHFHNFSRARLYSLLDKEGFEPLRYGISERYRVCMEVVARPKGA